MSAARLRLFQLVSPALPVGGFGYSEGLEVLVQAGRLADAAEVGDWLRAELDRGSLGLEAASLPELAASLRVWTAAPATAAGAAARLRLRERNGWLLAQRDAAELRAQQRQMGSALLQLLGDLHGPLPDPEPLAWPAAFAWAGVCLALGELALIEGYLYSWVAQQLSAAVRLVPLGPTEAQRLQLALAAPIAARARRLQGQGPEELWSAGVGAALAQLGHAELYSRLFRS